MAPGCLGAKGTSLSESIVLLRLLLGTAQVAVEALDSCQCGEEGTSVPQLGAPCTLCSSYSHVPRYGAGSYREIKDEFSWSLSTATWTSFWLAGQGRDWAVPVVLSPWKRSNPSVWTDQDLYLLQENMREGTLPVKDREKTLIPGKESLGLGPGAGHESSRPAPVFQEAFLDFSMFPQRGGD